MSTLVTATVKSNSSSPPAFQNSSGTQIGTLCRAWVNFNGTNTVAIRAQFNVSSITDNGTGDYTVNFTNALADANYSTIGSCNRQSGGGDGIVSLYANNGNGALVDPTTSAARINTSLFNNSDVDLTYVCVSIFR
jgi:hypothetical protein